MVRNISPSSVAGRLLGLLNESLSFEQGQDGARSERYGKEC